ncbi:hypothetical protein D1013_15475 [Euzebyella marina]|uniref:Uncharacterized protein n=1 Tax=Euzebyella marina TaxID=1761453 RepID=A0A3G2L8R6_9FLAO|nr:hypothetical protein [Euzebyella marina]AYN68678.1 hypothetical protein D1013_15475 [Euzebyella marina]
MKTIATLIFVLFIGVTSQAQKATEVKVNAIEKSIVTEVEITETFKTVKYEVARLYKRDNARVKKALSFTTKYNRAKMA